MEVGVETRDLLILGEKEMETRLEIYRSYWPSKRSLPGSVRPPPRKAFRFDLNQTADGLYDPSESQDADYFSKVPSLYDDLEVRILARFPISEIWKIRLLNKRFLAHYRTGEVFRVRKELEVREFCVFILTCGETNWRAFNRQFTAGRRLPELPADPSFMWGDRETICAGTHLIVSGMELGNPSLWRYEVPLNRWFKGPLMIDPRCLFASATRGDLAYVAGGLRSGTLSLLRTAEKYNPDTASWEQLPSMQVKRKLCAGIYMDSKFYVVGGRDENGDPLTCAEVFHEDKKIWVKIPDMLKDSPVSSGSPPLLAVVNDELYIIETSSNEMKVYLKGSNTWKTLGLVPVKTDISRGWGVAFKSLGDELLIMGASTLPNSGNGMTVYTCHPGLDGKELQWKLMDGGRYPSSNFIWNCSIMIA